MLDIISDPKFKPNNAADTYKHYANASKKNKTYLISFPKCGRTWLRVMLGKLFYELSGINDLRPDGTRLFYPEQIEQMPSMPVVVFSHDDSPNRKASVDDIETDKSHYANQKAILLIRDIRDVMVSLYFEITRRYQLYMPGEEPLQFDEGIHTYLHSSLARVDQFIHFYNIWAANHTVPQAFLLLRYETLLQQPQQELKRIVHFLELDNVSDALIEEVVAFAQFNNMQAMERNGVYGQLNQLKPGDVNDPESYKTRTGKAGNFSEYLNAADTAWLTHKLHTELSPFYGYR